MAARFGFFRAERGSETVDLAESRRRRLAVQLSALSQIGFLIEVFRLKKRRGSLACVGGKNRRIYQRKTAIVEIVAARLYYFVPDLQNGVLAGTAKPQVPVFHQKSRAVFLGRNGIAFSRLNNFKIRRVQFVTAG